MMVLGSRATTCGSIRVTGTPSIKARASTHLNQIRTEEGHISDSLETIKDSSFKYFNKLYTSSSSDSLQSDQDKFLETFPNSEIIINPSLSEDITLEELSASLKTLPKEKSPGLDGLTNEFFKATWDEVGPNLVEVANEARRRGFLSSGLNTALIVLIPKKGDLLNLENWRPISLMGTAYKIITKALALRIQPYLDGLISHN